MAHGPMYDNDDYYDEEDPNVKAGEQNLGIMDGTDEDSGDSPQRMNNNR